MLRVLFIGDICGKPGRQTVAQILPNLKKQKAIDFVIANAENAAGGRGVNRKILRELISSGVDFFTSGDHIWREKDFLDDLNDKNLPIIRPANFPEDVPYGRGYEIADIGSKGKIVIINLVGWVFMRELVLDPLRSADKILKEVRSKKSSIIVDFHCEATAEKAIMGHYLDGRVSAVMGTHTHVATADTKILQGGTGFVTDVGMVGPRDSSLWVQKEIAIHNYKYPYKKSFKMEKGGYRIFNSVILEVESNRCQRIERYDREIER
jgi:metallophosphoesterase (TIGR00282 family)